MAVTFRAPVDTGVRREKSGIPRKTPTGVSGFGNGQVRRGGDCGHGGRGREPHGTGKKGEGACPARALEPCRAAIGANIPIPAPAACAGERAWRRKKGTVPFLRHPTAGVACETTPQDLEASLFGEAADAEDEESSPSCFFAPRFAFDFESVW